MGRVVNIDYENIPGQANNIKNISKQLGDKLLDIYKNISAMHEFWYGKRYNDLVQNINKLIPQMNSFLEVTVSEVPHIIETIANNFSEVDTNGRVTAAQKEGFQKIEQLSIKEDVGMRFVSEEIANIEQTIISEFHEAISLVDMLSREAEGIGIDYDVGNNFKSQFKSFSNSFKQYIETAESQFTVLMLNTRMQMQKTEMANMV